ncbi:MAG: hypothetical protein G01um101472_29 [Parcubacteria group bacterium Gr01-1014_72]|jgi:predicted ATP-binding protein involved in virulence|nr:MAG: hypothetical protein G01um101472_29 [Parcubacteria group bacterium Gr01-1014_72]
MKKKKVTNENLAVMIEDLAMTTAKGFEDIEKRLSEKIGSTEERLDKKIESVEERLTQKINGVNGRIDHLVDTRVSWDAHKHLADRVTRIELRFKARR